MFQCILTTFDHTLKDNGGVGGFLFGINDNINMKVEWSNQYFVRFLYDNAANILFVVIFIQIVAGIIIDAFTDVREEEKIKNEDVKNVCFIRGIKREVIEK